MSGPPEAWYTSALRMGVVLPFVEGRGTFLSQHGESTVNGAAVLGRRGIHEARFDNVHRRRHDRRAEACTKGSSEVARQVIWARRGNKLSGLLQLHFQHQRLVLQLLTCHQAILEDQLLDQVVGHQLGAVYNRIAGDVGKTTWRQVKKDIIVSSWSESPIFICFSTKRMK